MADHSDYFIVFFIVYIILSSEVFMRVILPRLRSSRFKHFWDRKFLTEINPDTLPPFLILIVTQIAIVFLAELTISYLGPGTSEDIFGFYFVILFTFVPMAIVMSLVFPFLHKISDRFMSYKAVILFLLAMIFILIVMVMGVFFKSLAVYLYELINGFF